MSRYRIEAYNTDHLVVVGWDNALQSFFLTVDDLAQSDVEKQEVCWLGTQPHELPHLQALVEALRPYTTLRPEDQEHLQQDYDRREPPTPLQRHMLGILQRARAMP